jgi:predicted RNase H-like HicB family nuclease
MKRERRLASSRNMHNLELVKTLIQTHKEGKYFIAIDLITNVADQGLTESEAVSNLKKGLEEHYKVLLEMATKGRNSLS